MNPIVLVAPPFQSITTPALGVSQLKANLQERSFPAEVLYLNLLFADRIGVRLYEHISNRTTILLGDFIFSHLLFQHSEDSRERYAQELLGDDDLARQLSQTVPNGSLPEALARLTQAASDFVDDAVQLVLDRDPWMVGFSSTFQQNCSSLALMRRIKQQRPDLPIAMGGANCEGEMGEELFARFPEIDYLGQGECDHSFVELVASLHAESDPGAVPGFLTRRGNGRPGSPLGAEELEKLPHPDFHDYFEQLQPLGFSDQLLPALVMETSRGCWWGAKQHCTFCGLNATGMAFRSKSGARALAEMESLVKRYGIDRIAIVDNILDMKYFKTLLPRLAERPVADLFYEIKANLTKAQVQALAQARITLIQPGIESLSNDTLKTMRKGVTELQNLQLLKWCSELGIHVGWNYLFGFPGEREEELEQLAHDAEAIHHLEPPSNTGVLHLDRFSPYFNSPEEFGLAPVRPAKPYPHVYPFPEESLLRLAYFYDSDFFLEKKQSPAYGTLRAIVDRWRKAHVRSHLLAIPRKQSLILLDTRSCARRFWRRLTGVRRKVYEHCDKAESLSSILKSLGPETDRLEVEEILQEFTREKLVLGVNDRYLSLATDARGAYRHFAALAPVGILRVPGLRKSLQDLATGRSPRVIARALARRTLTACRVFANRCQLGALRLVVRALAEG